MAFPLVPVLAVAAAGGAIYYWAKNWSQIKTHLPGGDSAEALLPSNLNGVTMTNPDIVVPPGVSPTTGLPVFAYQPDLNPVGSGSAGTYFPRSVAQDVTALRFLGYTNLRASDVGGGVSQASDSARKQGAWHPGFQAALVAFTGNSADPWIGPSYRSRLAQAVAAKNAANQAANYSRGAFDSTFAGRRMRRAHIRKVLGG